MYTSYIQNIYKSKKTTKQTSEPSIRKLEHQNLNQKGHKNRVDFFDPVFPNTTFTARWKAIPRCADPYYVNFSEYQPVGSHPRGSHETVTAF